MMSSAPCARGIAALSGPLRRPTGRLLTPIAAVCARCAPGGLRGRASSGGAATEQPLTVAARRGGGGRTAGLAWEEARGWRAALPEPGPTAPVALLFDGTALLHRAHWAAQRVKEPLTGDDGRDVRALFLFARSWVALLEKLRSQYTGFVLDARGGSAARQLAFPAYKEARPPPPWSREPEQVERMVDLVRATGVKVLRQEGVEADDLLATYSRQAVEAGCLSRIVTRDKDLMQLVDGGGGVPTGRVRLFDPQTKTWVGEPEVWKKFKGPPGMVAAIQALTGDGVDGIPGINGIGVLTATRLLREFDSVEDMIANSHMIKSRAKRAKIDDNADQIRLALKLTTLIDDIELDVPFEELYGDRATEPYPLEGVDAFMDKLGFPSLLSARRRRANNAMA